MEKGCDSLKKGGTAILVQGDVKSHLIKLTIPMIFGHLGLVIFNLVDTFYVGMLGTNEMAALTFTFPVILIINSLALGIGIGASSVVSRAVGEENYKMVKRLATDSLTLAISLVVIFIIIGMLTIEPLFKMLGASNELIPLIKQYMQIWYLGMPFVVVPMVGNNSIRALGDTKTPGIIMMISGIVNAILDPIFIFGWSVVPAMGIKGAALATVIGRTITFCVACYVLIIREKVVILSRVSFKEILESWKKILHIGIPTAFTRMIIPIASGVITSLLASVGNEAVAGFGIATRFEFFILILINAVSSIMGPFVGQNLGAQKIDRVKKSISLSSKFALIYGAVAILFLQLLAPIIAGVFNNNQEVLKVAELYFRVVVFGYGFYGVFNISTTVLNVLKKPLTASAMMIFQMFILYVPLAKIGLNLFGVIGIFGALTISYIVGGIATHFVLKRNITKLENKYTSIGTVLKS